MAKRITWIVLSLLLAGYGLLFRPVVLGLDLKGGVTLRYELDEPDLATPGADTSELIDSTVETLRRRIDAYGILENSITRQGEREIVIELPGSSKDEAETLKSLVSRVGRLEFRLVMRPDGTDDDARNQLVVADEVERLVAFLAEPENQGRLPGDLNLTALDTDVPGGPLYRWVPSADDLIAQQRGRVLDDDLTIADVLAAAPLGSTDFALVKIERESGSSFSGADVADSGRVTDEKGGAAVGVTIRRDRASEFGDWTEPNIGRFMGIVLDGRLAQPPAVIQSRLEGQFQITSGKPTGFSETELKEYLTVIKSGSLQLKPRLLYEYTVGPSLGDSAIQAGFSAAVVGLLAVLAFVLAYYRGPGVVAAVCLLFNLVLMAGTLMFLGATLTLPGIAGLVLTLGMAVDANILIFERMREEGDRAKSVAQAVKLGFEKAFTTIMDSNLVGLVTAIILYKLGTGPVRGFAVVLILGIVTSVFSVLVLGRVLFDTLVDRGLSSLRMGRILKQQPAFGFIGASRKAMTLSAIAVVVSLGLFFSIDRDKYGLDFLGGYKAQVRLGSQVSQAEVQGRLAGSLFAEAQVVSVRRDDEEAAAGSSQYLIKLKSIGDTAGSDLEATYETPLKQALGGIILPDFVSDLTLGADAATATTAVSARLAFSGAVTPDAVGARLPFLADLGVSAADDGRILVSGRMPGIDLQPQQVVQRLRGALVGTAPLAEPSTPFIESTMISSAVGTELRDSAIRAILLSFVAIVLYIRVRFREYRYGFAAIIALAHDVIITLGMVALAHTTGLVDVEIDLAMVAVFLTIIGYSLNDTIVVFDRIRENLPRLSGKRYEEVLDISMNQTLARTLLTSATTLASLVVIFVLNYGKQNVLEGFAFAMVVGIIVGTYSSVFVAAPILTFMAGDERARSGPTGPRGSAKDAPRPAAGAPGVAV